MRVWSAVLASGIIVAMHPASPSAQGTWRLDGYAGVIPSVSTGLLDLDDASDNAAAAFGLSVQRSIGWRAFAVEGDFRVVPGFLKGRTADSLVTRSRLTIFSGSLIARPRWSDRIRPYGSLGLSSVHYAAGDRLSVLTHRSSFLGFAAAGGTSFYVASPLSIRSELRYLRTQRSAADGVFEDAFIDLVTVTIGAGIEW